MLCEYFKIRYIESLRVRARVRVRVRVRVRNKLLNYTWFTELLKLKTVRNKISVKKIRLSF